MENSSSQCTCDKEVLNQLGSCANFAEWFTLPQVVDAMRKLDPKRHIPDNIEYASDDAGKDNL